MGLARADKAKLTAALDQLPESMAYLRAPILNIARQDQDLLGCGEADPTAIIKALRARAEGDFVESADQLREWISSTFPAGEANSPWAGPIWFVEGFVRGCDLFGADAGREIPEPPKPPKPPAAGLKSIELDIPAAMKAKFYAGGVEVNDRNVKLFVIELEDHTY